MSGIRVAHYELMRVFDVRAVKEIIRGLVHRQSVTFEINDGRPYSIGLVARWVNLFGVDFLREMLSRGFRVQVTKDSQSALQYLLLKTELPEELFLETVQVLLEAGDVFPDETGDRVYSIYSPACIEKLLDLGMPRPCATWAKSPEMVELFLARGFAPNAREITDYPSEVIEMYVRAGWNIDTYSDSGWTALHRASWSGDLHRMRALMALGANPDLPVPPDASVKGWRGFTSKRIFANRYGSWKRHLGFEPFMVEIKGSRWRVEYSDQYYLIAQTLKSEAGLVEMRIRYGISPNDSICTFLLDGEQVTHRFSS